MSSIIDALKKSDNNRSTESAANVNQIKFGNEPPVKNRRGFWLLVVVLVLIALGVFAWTQGWHHNAIATAQSWFGTDQATQLDPLQETTEESSATGNNNQTTSESTQLVTERNNKLIPPRANEVKSKSLAADQTKTETDSERQQQLQVIVDRKTDSDTNNSEQDLTELTAKQEANQVEALKQSNGIDAEANKDKLMAQQNRKDLEPMRKQDYLLVHQIDFEIRKNIPPIKLNIHIYDPDPENRMVILNGVKYATGDSIEDMVTVEEINQQGVVLEFEGIKFLIPK